MRRLVLALAVVLAVTGFAGSASGGVRLHYARAHHAAVKRCGSKRAVGRNVYREGDTLANGKHVGAAKYRQLTARLDGLCRPVQTVPTVPTVSAAPTVSAPAQAASTSRSSGGYCGGYQFDDRTWQSVGGTGSACGASPQEQDQRALELYQQRGAKPWPHCGYLMPDLAAVRGCENSGRY
jgi:hypothetical protein